VLRVRCFPLRTLFKPQNARQIETSHAAYQRVSDSSETTEETRLKAIIFSDVRAEAEIGTLKGTTHSLIDYGPGGGDEIFAAQKGSYAHEHFCCAGAPATPVIESQEMREMREVGFDLCQELRITGPSPNARTRQQHPGEAAAPGPHPHIGPARRCGPVVGTPVKKLSIKFDGFLDGIQV
jgi:hypothetical protein